MRLPTVLLVVLLIATVVAAQDPEPDTIGLWFDSEATVNVIYDPQPLQQFTGYLVIHAPTHGQIAGIECAVDVPAGVYCTFMHCPPGFINWGDNYNVIVTWWPPLDGDPDFTAVRFDYIVLEVPELPAFFVLGPTDPSSFPETQSPGYGWVAENGDIFLEPLDYVFGDPAAARFEPGTVAVESRSLTSVKDLFD